MRFREADLRAVKRTWNGTFGMVPEWSPAGWRPASATPLEYLRRFALHNAIFLDDVRLEGVIVAAETSRIPGAVPGGCSLVISQRWLVAADVENPYPEAGEIADYMTERGFAPLPDSFFGWLRESDGILILDAKPDNFIRTPDGLLPFDLVIVQC